MTSLLGGWRVRSEVGERKRKGEMRFSRQEYWGGLSFPSPGNRPDPGIEPGSPALQADALPSEPPGKPFDWLVGVKSFHCRRGFLYICVPTACGTWVCGRHITVYSVNGEYMARPGGGVWDRLEHWKTYDQIFDSVLVRGVGCLA